MAYFRQWIANFRASTHCSPFPSLKAIGLWSSFLRQTPDRSLLSTPLYHGRSFTLSSSISDPHRYVKCLHRNAKTVPNRRRSFVDRITVLVQGGSGGPGCASFSKGPNQELVPPDGGHGGRGGSVWFEASTECTSLRMSSHNLKAENGRPGMSAKRHGRNGSDLVVRVPPGTVVRELDAINGSNGFEGLLEMEMSDMKMEDHLSPRGILVCELNRNGQRAEVAQGGGGGRGNVAFKSSQNRSPTTADPGEQGQRRRLELELKTIADVGLVGLPNAGKSTFLRAVSSAKPKVASYPFTTLRPHIGVVNADGKLQDKRIFTVADIPGLIEGAHDNRGLGHEFLRHIERTAFLVYVLDVSGEEGSAIKAFNVLQNELEMHEPGLSQRSRCIVANKMDSGGAVVENLNDLLDELGSQIDIFPVSARFETGVEDVIRHISESLP